MLFDHGFPVDHDRQSRAGLPSSIIEQPHASGYWESEATGLEVSHVGLDPEENIRDEADGTGCFGIHRGRSGSS